MSLSSLLIQIAPFLAVLLWFSAILMVLNWVGSYSYGKLARLYGYTAPFNGPIWSFQSVVLGALRYRGLMTLGANAAGLYLAPFVLTRLGHPPLLVPWRALRLEDKRRWGGLVCRLRIQAESAEVKLDVSSGLLGRMQAASEGQLSSTFGSYPAP